MADLSITAASVVAGSGATILHGTAGATITAGQAVYLNGSDSKLYPADADLSAVAAAAVGIALHGSLAGQPLSYVTAGNLTAGGTLTVAGNYIASATAGGIAPIGDMATGMYLTILGYASTVANLVVGVKSTGVLKP